MSLIVQDIMEVLEHLAPLALQESYDNSGLLTGNPMQMVTGVLITLDVTEATVQQAIHEGCNLIISHHPLIFTGIKQLTGSNATERTLLLAIRHQIAMYAIHTNLDNVITGVNLGMAAQLHLQTISILQPMSGRLRKLITYAPRQNAEEVRQALFAAGAGQIGNYDHCSFNSDGEGTFRPGKQAQPAIGEIGVDHVEPEVRIEVIFPDWITRQLITALQTAHPYEEVAFEVIQTDNKHQEIGAGMIGWLPNPMEEMDFLQLVKEKFSCGTIRHTALTGRKIHKVAICGGSGSFLIANALAAKADAFLTADIKYHQFFEADGRILLADIGHFESEQFTIQLLESLLKQKFANFAPSFPIIRGINTNPVKYF
jgi:dinuclear metal center YbgI/SA1388 family protein